MPAQFDIVFVSKASRPNLDKVLTLSCAEKMCWWWYFSWIATRCGHQFGETVLRQEACARARELGYYGACGNVQQADDVQQNINILCDVCQLPN